MQSGLIPYCATFFIFTDYMRGAIRMSALSEAGVIFVMTHDSIGLGEDGPTHQVRCWHPCSQAALLVQTWLCTPGAADRAAG